MLGAGQAVFRPALQSVIPALVPDPAALLAANALLDATERIPRLLGPALVGALVVVLCGAPSLVFGAVGLRRYP